MIRRFFSFIKKFIFWCLAILVVLTVVSIFVFLFLGKECSTKECFIEEANKCEKATYVAREEFGTIQYDVNRSCEFNKKFKKLADSEPEALRKYLEGQSLTCKFEASNFDKRWVDSLFQGLGNCEGKLKERLGLIIFLSGKLE